MKRFAIRCAFRFVVAVLALVAFAIIPLYSWWPARWNVRRMCVAIGRDFAGISTLLLLAIVVGYWDAER